MLVSNREADYGELIGSSVGREDITLLSGVVCGARNSIVDLLARSVIHESKCSTRIGDGSVASAVDGLTSNYCGCAGELPEALRVIDGGVGGGLASEGSLVDITEGVEGVFAVSIISVGHGAEVCGEELRVFADIRLRNHVLDGCLNRFRGHGIDVAPCETEKAVAGTLLELGRKRIGKLDSLVFDDQSADVDIVSADGTGGGGAVLKAVSRSEKFYSFNDAYLSP